MIKKHLAFFLIATVTISSLWAGNPPKNVILTISTKPLQQATADVDALTGATLANTPFMMLAAPGMINNALSFKLLGLTPEVIDISKPAHFILYVTEKKRPRALILLGMDNFSKSLKTLEAGGFQMEALDNGIYKAEAPSGRNVYLKDAGEGWVYWSPKKSDLTQGLEVVGTWRPEPSKHTLELCTYVDTIVAQNSAVIESLPMILEQKMSEPFAKENQEYLPAVKEAAAIIGKFAVTALKETQAARITLDSSATGLIARSITSAKADTTFAKLNTTLAKVPSTDFVSENIKYLPPTAYSVAATNVNPEANKEILGFILDSYARILKTLPAEAQKSFELNTKYDLPKILAAVSSTRGVFSYGASEGSLFDLCSIYEIPAGAKATLEDIITTDAEKLMAAYTKLITMSGEKTYNPVMTRGKVEGIDIITIKMNMTMPNKNDIPMMPAMQEFLELAASAGDYTIGLYENKYIVTGGAKSQELFKQIINNIKSKKATLPANVIADYSKNSSGTFSYGATYLSSMVKQLATALSKVIKLAPPEAITSINTFVNGIAGDTPMLISSKAVGTELIFEMNIPVASYKSAVDQGVKVYMQEMMRKKMQQ